MEYATPIILPIPIVPPSAVDKDINGVIPSALFLLKLIKKEKVSRNAVKGNSLVLNEKNIPYPKSMKNAKYPHKKFRMFERICIKKSPFEKNLFTLMI